MKTKRNVADMVRDELAWDARINADQIVVDATGEVVRLAGTVGSLAEKMVAADIAVAMSDVHDVLNHIDVRTDAAGPSDEDLSEIVSRMLRWDALVPEDRIDVDVTDGWLTLRGSVAVDAQRREAERAVRHLVGLRGITNDLTIAEADLTPAQVRSAIVAALERRADHTAAHIDVAVNGHTVTIRGRLQSHAEKRAVIGAVTHAPGIDVVFDEIVCEG